MALVLRRVLGSPWTYFALAGVLAAITLSRLLASAVADRPLGGLRDLQALSERSDLNVVFFLIDALRADHLSCYGYERQTSPLIDRLAASGVRFARVESQSSWTKPSMASLWTGAYPHRIGVTRYSDAVSPDATLAAEILREAGFTTVGLIRNFWVAANFGFAQGFDHYVAIKAARGKTQAFVLDASPGDRPGSDWDVSGSAQQLIRSHGPGSFFLYLHYMDLHQRVYETESAKFGTDVVDLYDNAIHWTDRNVGAVLEVLEEQGLLESTIIVIASDHGEAFFEHGFEGHGRDLYRESTHTPLIISLPFRLEPGVVVRARVQNVDVWPTLLELLGLPALPQADGRSLVPLVAAAIRGESRKSAAELVRRSSFAELDRSWSQADLPALPMVSVAAGRFRLVQPLYDPSAAELFDVAVDPLERRNVSDRYPRVLARMRARILAHMAEGAVFTAPQVELDALCIDQLRALGYLGRYVPSQTPDEAED